MGFFKCFQRWCAIDKLDELWGVKYDLVEEGDIELVGGGATEVLPILQNIFLEELQSSGPVQEGIQQFVAARQVTSHPITVSRWDSAELDKFWGNLLY